MPSPFEAHPMVRGGQLQTLLGYLWSGAPKLETEEFIQIVLPDGDRLELAINHPTVPAKANLYLMHGLGGDAEASYKLRIAKKLLPLGYRIIRHNHRGKGRHVGEIKGIYHSGSALDVLECLKGVASRWPELPLGLIGFSLSGTILLNLLGHHSKELEELGVIKAALTVCAPLDLQESSRALGLLTNKHYDLFYALTTLAELRRRKIVTDPFVKKHLSKPSLRKIDEYITAPTAGYRNADHYYETCSPKNIIHQIKIRTLILAAADDPIVPSPSVLQAALSPSVQRRMEVSGGHMGFVCRRLTTHGDYRWLDSFVEAWASQHLLQS